MTSANPANIHGRGISPPDMLTVVVNDRMLGNEFLIASTGRDRAASSLPGPARVAMHRKANPRPATATRSRPRRSSPKLAFHLALLHHH